LAAKKRPYLNVVPSRPAAALPIDRVPEAVGRPGAERREKRKRADVDRQPAELPTLVVLKAGDRLRKLVVDEAPKALGTGWAAAGFCPPPSSGAGANLGWRVGARSHPVFRRAAEIAGFKSNILAVASLTMKRLRALESL
jgi:hypothetical protein